MKIFLVLILYLFITVLSHIVGDGNLISSDSKKEDINQCINLFDFPKNFS